MHNCMAVNSENGGMSCVGQEHDCSRSDHYVADSIAGLAFAAALPVSALQGGLGRDILCACLNISFTISLHVLSLATCKVHLPRPCFLTACDA
jgi:hypothetical protein